MPKHRYFYIVNGERKEELVGGKWVKANREAVARTHNVVRDQLGGVNGIYNPATRKRYDSNSRYQQDTKAAGCTIVGNDSTAPKMPRARVQESFATTVERLNQQKGWGL